MNRIYEIVPDVAFRMVVAGYAKKMGKPYVTVKQQQEALFNYCTWAYLLN